MFVLTRFYCIMNNLMHEYRVFFKVDLGVNFAPRFFGVTPRFCSAAATAVLSYTTILVGRGHCSVELHQGLNLKKNLHE